MRLCLDEVKGKEDIGTEQLEIWSCKLFVLTLPHIIASCLIGAGAQLYTHIIHFLLKFTWKALPVSYIAGMNGTDGEQGPVGPFGPQGPVGPAGPQGSVGPVGPQGIAGMNGTHGEQGPVGPQGPVGAPGLDGRNGSDGSPGPPGTVPDAVIEQLKENILVEVLKLLPSCKGIFRNNPSTSCKEIHDCAPTTPSGYYWVNTTTGPLQVYCQMDTNNCGNITGGWMRAAYIDMTIVNNTCPQGLNYISVNSTRMCTDMRTNGCTSVTFPTHMLPYTMVCGRARGYQFASPDGFIGSTSLDSSYVDGLIVTHGNPRDHIWTFTVGASKDFNHGDCCNCPCAFNPGSNAPTFVGERYFCESGVNGHWVAQWYLDDPLWDSQRCESGSTCCDRGGPWFTTTLSQEASDDIEVRLCLDEVKGNEDIGIEQLEILVI